VRGLATLAECILFGRVLGPASLGIVGVASLAGVLPLARHCFGCLIAVASGMLNVIAVVLVVIIIAVVRTVDIRPEAVIGRDAAASSALAAAVVGLLVRA
jgi:hypothetical protein